MVDLHDLHMADAAVPPMKIIHPEQSELPTAPRPPVKRGIDSNAPMVKRCIMKWNKVASETTMGTPRRPSPPSKAWILFDQDVTTTRYPIACDHREASPPYQTQLGRLRRQVVQRERQSPRRRDRLQSGRQTAQWQFSVPGRPIPALRYSIVRLSWRPRPRQLSTDRAGCYSTSVAQYGSNSGLTLSKSWQYA